MSQNTSTAVMQRRVEPRDSLDDFPTPPWAARALCEHVIATDSQSDLLWEPAVNRGYLLRGLNPYFLDFAASDIHDYGAGFDTHDFLFDNHGPECDWIITNPPFRLAEQFARKANSIARKGVALLVRSAFTEGVSRYRDLFSVCMPHTVAQFSERVPMVKGRCDGKASSATAYCWIVWRTNTASKSGTRFAWIPPCRKQLECDGDYA